MRSRIGWRESELAHGRAVSEFLVWASITSWAALVPPLIVRLAEPARPLIVRLAALAPPLRGPDHRSAPAMACRRSLGPRPVRSAPSPREWSAWPERSAGLVGSRTDCRSTATTLVAELE